MHSENANVITLVFQCRKWTLGSYIPLPFWKQQRSTVVRYRWAWTLQKKIGICPHCSFNATMGSILLQKRPNCNTKYHYNTKYQLLKLCEHKRNDMLNAAAWLDCVHLQLYVGPLVFDWYWLTAFAYYRSFWLDYTWWWMEQVSWKGMETLHNCVCSARM